MRIFRIVTGTVLVLLGALWALQGADLVHIRTILCFGDCEPLVGGSTTWLVLGLVAFLAGVRLLLRARVG